MGRHQGRRRKESRGQWVTCAIQQLERRILLCGLVAPHYVSGTAPFSGVVFNDINGNGARDDGEPGLGGVTIRADEWNGGTVSTVTDAQGHYAFTDIHAWDMEVDVDGDPRWTRLGFASGPGDYRTSIWLRDGDNLGNKDFALHYDDEAPTVQATFEEVPWGHRDWKLMVSVRDLSAYDWQGHASEWQSALVLVGPDGTEYSLQSVTDYIYRSPEERYASSPMPFVVSAPAGGWTPELGGRYELRIRSGMLQDMWGNTSDPVTVASVDAVFPDLADLVSITGTVSRPSGPLAGRQVYLDSYDGGPCWLLGDEATTTDADGRYFFGELRPGNYAVRLGDDAHDAADFDNRIRQLTLQAGEVRQLDFVIPGVTRSPDPIVVWGTDGDDVIHLRVAEDVLIISVNQTFVAKYLISSDDVVTIYGLAGDDMIRGELGWGSRSGIPSFVEYGGEGNDTLWGGANADTLWGGQGNDDLVVQWRGDLAYGEEGDDRLESIAERPVWIYLFGDGTDPTTKAPSQLRGGEGYDTFVLSGPSEAYGEGGEQVIMECPHYGIPWCAGHRLDPVVLTIQDENPVVYHRDDVQLPDPEPTIVIIHPVIIDPEPVPEFPEVIIVPTIHWEPIPYPTADVEFVSHQVEFIPHQVPAPDPSTDPDPVLPEAPVVDTDAQGDSSEEIIPPEEILDEDPMDDSGDLLEEDLFEDDLPEEDLLADDLLA